MHDFQRLPVFARSRLEPWGSPDVFAGDETGQADLPENTLRRDAEAGVGVLDGAARVDAWMGVENDNNNPFERTTTKPGLKKNQQPSAWRSFKWADRAADFVRPEDSPEILLLQDRPTLQIPADSGPVSAAGCVPAELELTTCSIDFQTLRRPILKSAMS